MRSVLNISQASAIGFHTAILLAGMKEMKLSARQISEILQVSQAHLNKVLQLLSKAGIVTATSGPEGGYTLAKSADKITLMDIYQAIEGNTKRSNCLLKKRICKGKCFLGNFIKDVSDQMYKYLSETYLFELVDLLKVKRYEN